jgi:hypothetical protein
MGAADWVTVGVAVAVVEPVVVAVPVLAVAEEFELVADAVLALAAVLAVATMGVAAAIEPLNAPNPITLAVTDASFSRARRRRAAATLLARSSVMSFSFIRFLLLVKPW